MRLWKDILAGIFMGLIVPGVLLNFAVLLLRQPSEAMEVVVTLPQRAAEETVPLETTCPPLCVWYRNGEGEVSEQNMDDYLVGVVLAEMPAWFETEALKAQAVVARTYALKAYSTGGKHGDGSVCGQSACCQAYISEADYQRQGGSLQSIEKVRAAVTDTSGYVLIYDGELIEATYFSCSGGSTEDAAAVWGTDYPYLRAVSSPGEEAATHYTDTEYFAIPQFCEALGISPESNPETLFGKKQYTPGGGIDQMEIGGQIFTGVQLRQRLGLRSTAISMTAEDNRIVVTTKGFGHRVGMSQYGADAMAVSGHTYSQILAHYYAGTTLVLWESNDT